MIMRTAERSRSVRARGPDRRSTANRRYAAGRTCASDGCSTRLSRYNPSPRCWTHEERRDAVLLQVKRRKVSRETEPTFVELRELQQILGGPGARHPEPQPEPEPGKPTPPTPPGPPLEPDPRDPSFPEPLKARSGTS